MKFQITIKEQSEAINGKAKYPLYKAANEKPFDDDRGFQALEQLFQHSSIKIFCDECQKEITLQTILISYEGQAKMPPQKLQNQQLLKSKGTNEEKSKIMQKGDGKSKGEEQGKSMNLNKSRQKVGGEIDEIFQEKDSSESEVNDQMMNEQLRSDVKAQSEQEREDQKNQQQQANQQQLHQQNQAIEIGREATRLYCVGCFACLDEFPKMYSIRKCLKFSTLNSSWTVFDEVNLLNGLKFWGFGNWGQIKEFMDYNSSPFSVNQIQSHYEELYLKAQGPTFPKPHQFEITKTCKPPKKLLEDVMHQYYHPSIQKNMKMDTQITNQSRNSKKETIVNTAFQDKIAQNFHRQSQRHPFVGHSSKHLRPNNNFLHDTIHASNTSLHEFNGDNENIKQQRPFDLDENQSSESELQEGSDLSDLDQVHQNQIKLKPKLSSHVHQNRGNGKGLKQGLPRSYHYFPQEHNKSHQMAIHQRYGKQGSPNPQTKLKGQNVYSYNPKRKQFEIIEYDYYAESMLAFLEFSEQDSQEQVQLKIKIIEEYNKRLDERIKRRQFVIQHRLLDTDFMIKTLHKYNKANFQIFQPFRRLIPKNQDYFKILDLYDKMSKASSLTQGIIDVKRKVKKTHKNPQIKHFIQYLNQKKQKKELLGKRARFENESERRVLCKQSAKTTKKMITSMGENSYTYINYQVSGQQQPLSLSNHQGGQTGRTMVSRSQERERMRANSQQNTNRQGLYCGSQQMINENLNFGNIGLSNNLVGVTIGNSLNLSTLVSEEDLNSIERNFKNQSFDKINQNDFKPFTIKNLALKPLTLKHAYKN